MFYVTVDGVVQDNTFASGECSDQTVVVNVPAGNHRIAFIYEKDFIDAAGDDEVVIYNLQQLLQVTAQSSVPSCSVVDGGVRDSLASNVDSVGSSDKSCSDDTATETQVSVVDTSTMVSTDPETTQTQTDANITDTDTDTNINSAPTETQIQSSASPKTTIVNESGNLNYLFIVFLILMTRFWRKNVK